MARGFAAWFIVFSDCLASLVVNSSSFNRQDVKNAKVGFDIPAVGVQMHIATGTVAPLFKPAPRTFLPPAL